MFYRIFRIALRSTTGILILVFLILSAALWYFGPLLGYGDFRPLDSWTNRLIAIGGYAVFTLILILILMLRRRSQDKEMTETIVDSAADMADAAVKAELGEMQDRMKEALGFLRKSKLGSRFSSRHLYQLPWYIIIGPPGAGKTTAIVNSGLNFPLAERMGTGAIGGVGGTRNCDWWFTNDAVLLDTAGRYTTQDSNADTDSQAWSGFLDMLKKHRKRQPINGAMIAISLSDLSMQDETTRAGHARAIRTRLHELRERLGVRFPVYILFTKADLIAGFSEFYDNLGSDERSQVWGFTLPFTKGKSDESPMAAFRTEFDTLLSQLANRSLERMQAETDYQRRSLIAGFPSQIASLRGVAEQFLGDVFQDSRYEDKQLLRGVYFTSGTQEGTPIDRLMMGMARTFGIGRQAIGSGQGTGRSYFLTRLLESVIFPEAGMVSADDAVERRFKWITRGAIAVGLVVVTAFSSLWTMSYLGNSNLISNARAEVSRYQEIAARIPGSPIGDSDLPAIVPALDILRDLPGNPAQGDPEPPTQLTWGLYQGGAVGTEAAQTYRGGLNQLLLPRLLFRLEEQMQANMNNTDLLYEGLKIYLMLGLQGPMDEDLVKQWMAIDWSLAYPGQDEMQADLAGHLDQMLSQPMREIALNGPLVDQIQGLLSETPLAERIYNGITQSPLARGLPQFRLTEVGGPAASRVLVRSSGRALSDGVEGVFTYDGFNKVFLPEALSVATRIQSESWVLGPRGETATTPANLARLTNDVLNLYYNDYVARYDQLLGDIDVVPMESLSHAVDVTNVLSGPTSPIVAVLKAISEETKLATPKKIAATAEGIAAGAQEFATDDALSSLDARTQILIQTLNRAQENSATAEAPAKPGQYVQDRFEWLHNLVDGVEGAPSQLDSVVQTMTEVYRELNRLSLGQGNGIVNQAGGGNAAAKLQAETGRLPGPMQRWANQIASGSSGIAAGGARTNLNALWQAKVYPFCERALNNRYPFSKTARADVTLQDFGKLFGPNGLIDSFFNENLITFVDTTSNPWRWKKVNNTDLGISNSVLSQFQRAAEIRDSFFLSPGLPSVTFDLTPVALDPKAEQVILEVEGQDMTYAHGPPQVTPLTWPGKAGGRTRVAFAPEQAGIENAMVREGPWAWFRLLDSAEIRRTNVSDRSRVIFNIGGRISVFQLRAGSALNPFTLPALASFRCPKSM